jgi:hypothetical protein
LSELRRSALLNFAGVNDVSAELWQDTVVSLVQSLMAVKSLPSASTFFTVALKLAKRITHLADVQRSSN